MQTLVVNYSFEPVQIVDWQKAVYLIVTKKAEILVGYEKIIRSVSLSIQLPKIVRLRQYVKMKKKKLKGFRKSDVFERDAWTCQYCTKLLSVKTATLDHIVPRSKGGQNTFENTVCCCTGCNSKKANISLEDSGMKLLKRPAKPSYEISNETSLPSELRKAFDALMSGE